VLENVDLLEPREVVDLDASFEKLSKEEKKRFSGLQEVLPPMEDVKIGEIKN